MIKIKRISYRQALACAKNQVLTYLQLQSRYNINGQDQIRYHYKCGTLPLPFDLSAKRTQADEWGNGHVVFLDRHHPHPSLVSGRFTCQRQLQEQTKLMRRRIVRTPRQRAVEGELSTPSFVRLRLEIR